MPDRTSEPRRTPVRVDRRFMDRAFEFGQELAGPAPGAVGRGGALPDGAEEARRFADFVRRRRETPLT